MGPCVLVAANSHPDHDTIWSFRRSNRHLLEQSFERVLELSAELKLTKSVQITVSVDGTKVAANASKHPAEGYERAGEPDHEGGRVRDMKCRLSCRARQALDRLRQQTVEPVFGFIKGAIRFQRLLLSGLEKVKLE